VDTLARDILDRRPKANRGLRANMLSMNRLAAHSTVSPPRRFILLPEETADVSTHRPRIRRYRLSSLGQGAGPHRARQLGGDGTAAGMARELGELGRM